MDLAEIFATFCVLQDHDLLNRGLTYAQQRLAYGVHRSLIDDEEGSEIVQQYIQALQKRPKVNS